MSRVATPPMTPTAAMPAIPHEKIAMRAYEKWLKRGCGHGNALQDWTEAEKELKAELSRTGSNSTRR